MHGSTLAGCAALLIVAASCSSSPDPYPVVHSVEAPVPAPEPASLVIAAGATVEVKFFYTPELDQEQVVRPDGRISLPLIGDVAVAGKSPDTVREELLSRYRGRLVDPDIIVILRSWPDQRVLVGGEVKAPGVYDMPGPMTALDAVMLAGGPDFREADVSQVVVIRREGDRQHGYLVDLEPTLAGQRTPPFVLRPLDVVFVPRTAVAEVNQWINQYITQMVPEIELFWRYPVGKATVGIGTTR